MVQRAMRINGETNCAETSHSEGERVRLRAAQLNQRHYDSYPSRPSVMAPCKHDSEELVFLEDPESRYMMRRHRVTAKQYIGSLFNFFSKHDHDKCQQKKYEPPNQLNYVVTHNAGSTALAAVCLLLVQQYFLARKVTRLTYLLKPRCQRFQDNFKSSSCLLPLLLHHLLQLRHLYFLRKVSSRGRR